MSLYTCWCGKRHKLGSKISDEHIKKGSEMVHDQDPWTNKVEGEIPLIPTEVIKNIGLPLGVVKDATTDTMDDHGNVCTECGGTFSHHEYPECEGEWVPKSSPRDPWIKALHESRGAVVHPDGKPEVVIHSESIIVTSYIGPDQGVAKMYQDHPAEPVMDAGSGLAILIDGEEHRFVVDDPGFWDSCAKNGSAKVYGCAACGTYFDTLLGYALHRPACNPSVGNKKTKTR